MNYISTVTELANGSLKIIVSPVKATGSYFHSLIFFGLPVLFLYYVANKFEIDRWISWVSYKIWAFDNGIHNLINAVVDSLPALGICIGIAIVMRGAIAIINSTR